MIFIVCSIALLQVNHRIHKQCFTWMFYLEFSNRLHPSLLLFCRQRRKDLFPVGGLPDSLHVDAELFLCEQPHRSWRVQQLVLAGRQREVRSCLCVFSVFTFACVLTFLFTFMDCAMILLVCSTSCCSSSLAIFFSYISNSHVSHIFHFSDMLDWMSAINAHIHMRYLAEWHITTDFWERGNVETTFWKVNLLPCCLHLICRVLNVFPHCYADASVGVERSAAPARRHPLTAHQWR